MYFPLLEIISNTLVTANPCLFIFVLKNEKKKKGGGGLDEKEARMFRMFRLTLFS